MTKRIIYVSTSDRSTFRKCRRLWNWSSPMRMGLRPLTQARPLWLGSAGHHALEDYHGHKLYPSTDAAVDDYVQASIKCYGADKLPDDFRSDVETIKSILNHYTTEWLAWGRDSLNTLHINGVPQVEVEYEFQIPVPASLLRDAKADEIRYRCTFDRITVDDDGYEWVNDYKFVSAFTSPDHLELDSQIGVYMWAARTLYGKQVAGFIYNQFKKVVIDAPRVLVNGLISSDKRQSTTHSRYRAALIEKYGTNTANWPEDNMQCLNTLCTHDEPNADKFIRRDEVNRNSFNSKVQGEILLQELSDLLNPKINIYPSPSFLCPGSCAFIEPCLQIDKGEDYKSTLQCEYQKQTIEDRNNWRDYLTTKPKPASITVPVKSAKKPIPIKKPKPAPPKLTKPRTK